MEAKNGEGNTPLHVAAAHGWPQSVALLLREGSNPRIRNNLGRTPLELAQDCQNQEVVEAITNFLGRKPGNRAQEAPTAEEPRPSLKFECSHCSQEAELVKFTPCGHTGACHKCCHNWKKCQQCGALIDGKQQLSTLNGMSEQQCVVCLDTPRQRAVFLNCGHANCCLACAKTIQARDPYPTCPTCRNPVQTVVRIFT